MNKIVAVTFKHQKKIHIVENQDITICGLPIPLSSKSHTKIYHDHIICSKCLEKIGEKMLYDYVGWDAIGHRA